MCKRYMREGRHFLQLLCNTLKIVGIDTKEVKAKGRKLTTDSILLGERNPRVVKRRETSMRGGSPGSRVSQSLQSVSQNTSSSWRGCRPIQLDSHSRTAVWVICQLWLYNACSGAAATGSLFPDFQLPPVLLYHRGLESPQSCRQ